MHFWRDLWPELVVLLSLIVLASGLFLTFYLAQ